MGLDLVIGNLLAYRKLVSGTFQHSAELVKELGVNAELEDQWVYTADGAIYFTQNGKPMLAMTREEQNPLLQNLSIAFSQLLQIGHYPLSSAEAEQAISAADTELFTLTKLRLSSLGNSSYLAVSTDPEKYTQLNVEERRLAERVYGTGTDFVENMKRFKANSVSSAQIIVPSPEDILEKTRKSALALASWQNFYDDQFRADLSYVDNCLFLCGRKA